MNVLIRGFLLDRMGLNATPKTIGWHTRSISRFPGFLLANDISTDPDNTVYYQLNGMLREDTCAKMSQGQAAIILRRH